MGDLQRLAALQAGSEEWGPTQLASIEIRVLGGAGPHPTAPQGRDSHWVLQIGKWSSEEGLPKDMLGPQHSAVPLQQTANQLKATRQQEAEIQVFWPRGYRVCFI